MHMVQFHECQYKSYKPNLKTDEAMQFKANRCNAIMVWNIPSISWYFISTYIKLRTIQSTSIYVHKNMLLERLIESDTIFFIWVN